MITDELREYTKHYSVAGSKKDTMLSSIADRIDAEYERVRAESIIEMTDESMAEHGFVRLPKDADGEYVHIGDRVENNEIVARIVLTDGSWEPSVYTYTEKLSGILHEYFCNEISHYHRPTVEEVLTEMLDAWGELPANETNEVIIAKYAQRLQLRDES